MASTLRRVIYVSHLFVTTVLERVENAKLDWEKNKWEKENKLRLTSSRMQLVTMAMDKGMSSKEAKEFMKLAEKGLEDEDDQ